MKYFCEPEDVGDVEWTEVIVEGVVEESVVDGEEDCSLLRFRCLWEEGQVEAVYN